VDELVGGTPEENAGAIREVFAGARGGRREAILLNAAGAIAAAGHATDLREGLELAREAVDSGAAAARLDALIAFSRSEEVPA
jgi:anthranilate phosphoribosyltransferase